MFWGETGFAGGLQRFIYLRRAGDVRILDNLSRRRIDAELGAQSLTPIQDIQTRLRAWKEVSNRDISFAMIDIAQDYDAFRDDLEAFEPDAIVHFAEQRAAPYSMKSPRHKRYTVDNNLNATHNVCCAIAELGRDIHLVHLGTMGVYGYGSAGMKIPEGYLKVQVERDDGSHEEREILYPVNPGSIYHLTKTQDQLFFAYFNKNETAFVSRTCTRALSGAPIRPKRHETSVC